MSIDLKFIEFTADVLDFFFCFKLCIPVHGVLCHNLTKLTDVPGNDMRFLQNFQESWSSGTEVLQNFQNFRARVLKFCRNSASYGYCGTGVQKFRAGE